MTNVLPPTTTANTSLLHNMVHPFSPPYLLVSLIFRECSQPIEGTRELGHSDDMQRESLL